MRYPELQSLDIARGLCEAVGLRRGQMQFGFGRASGQRVMGMKKVYAIMVLVALAGMVALGGCVDDGPGQGRQEQEEACALGRGACINNCHKKDLGSSCVLCCRRKNLACNASGDYEFEACVQ